MWHLSRRQYLATKTAARRAAAERTRARSRRALRKGDRQRTGPVSGGEAAPAPRHRAEGRAGPAAGGDVAGRSRSEFTPEATPPPQRRRRRRTPRCSPLPRARMAARAKNRNVPGVHRVNDRFRPGSRAFVHLHFSLSQSRPSSQRSPGGGAAGVEELRKPSRSGSQRRACVRRGRDEQRNADHKQGSVHGVGLQSRSPSRNECPRLPA